MKLRVLESRGWCNFKVSKEDAKKNHSGYERIKYFHSSSINSRISWKFNTKNYSKSKDIDGITDITWDELPSESYKTATISAAVASAIAACKIPAAIPAAILVATSAAIAGLLLERRCYIAGFNSYTGELVTEDEANKIRKLNRGKIKQKLQEIDELIDEKKVEKYDLDKAKEELIKLNKEQGNHLSNINRKIMNDLLIKRNKEEIEMFNFLNKKFEKLKNEMEIVKKKLDKAKTERAEIYKVTMKKLEKVDKEIQQSRKEVDKKYEAAEKHRNELQQKLKNKLNKNNDDLAKKLDEANIKLSEAKKKREEIYQNTNQNFKETWEEIKISRKNAKEFFKTADKDRINNLITQQESLEKLEKSLQDQIELKFQEAGQDREEIANEAKKATTQLLSNLEKAQEDRKNKFVKLEKLSKKQNQNLEKFNKNFQEKSKKIVQSIDKLKEEQTQRFDEAIKHREFTYKKMDNKITKVHSNLLELRKFADTEFKKAILQRKEVLKETGIQIKQVNDQVYKLRQEAEDNYLAAVEHRNQIFSETTKEIYKNREEILEFREEANKRFDEAEQHRNEIYKKTENLINKVDEETTEVIKKSEQKLKSTEEFKKKTFEETDRKFDKLEETKETLVEVIENEFIQSQEHCEEIFKNVKKQESVLINAANGVIDTKKLIKDIEKKHKLLLKKQIKDFKTSVLEAGKESTKSPSRKEVNKTIKFIDKRFAKYEETKNVEYLAKALEKGTKIAMQYRSGYDTETKTPYEAYSFEKEKDKFSLLKLMKLISSLENNKIKKELLENEEKTLGKLFNLDDKEVNLIEVINNDKQHEIEKDFVQIDKIQQEITNAISNIPKKDSTNSSIDQPIINDENWYSNVEMKIIREELLQQQGIDVNSHQYQERLTPNLVDQDFISATMRELDKGKSVFISYNPGNHWVAVCIIKVNGQIKVLYKDSLGGDENRNNLKVKLIEEFAKAKIEFNDQDFVVNSSQEQEDSFNCGPITLSNLESMATIVNEKGAEYLLNNFSKIKFCTSKDASILRNKHAKIIDSKSQPNNSSDGTKPLEKNSDIKALNVDKEKSKQTNNSETKINPDDKDPLIQQTIINSLEAKKGNTLEEFQEMEQKKYKPKIVKNNLLKKESKTSSSIDKKMQDLALEHISKQNNKLEKDDKDKKIENLEEKNKRLNQELQELKEDLLDLNTVMQNHQSEEWNNCSDEVKYLGDSNNLCEDA
jgi:hypothetical protein